MVNSRAKLALASLAIIAALSVASPAFAQTTGGGMFDDIQNRFAAVARGWATAMTNAATFLFMGLAAISLVWTMGLMALRRSDLGEFFSEFLRFVIFTGFYLFLLRNGAPIADAIIKSLQQLGQNASSMGDVTPGSIVDIGFQILSAVVDHSSILEPVDSAVGILMAAVILVVLALVAVNMLLLIVSAWILAYGGIFFLGFGGARWTSDMAINYFKTVLGIGASLMAMVLLVGIGKSFIDQFYNSMTQGDPSIKELGALMVCSVILLALVNKIPGLVAGIITGASVGGAANVGSFGAGAAVTAGGMAVAAAATGGAALAAGAVNAAGGASAISAAFKSAQDNMASGGGMFSGSGSGSGGSSSGGGSSGSGSLGPDGGGGGGGGGGGPSPLTSAMGGSGGGGGGGRGANDNAGDRASSASGAGAETATSGAGSPAGTPGGGIAGAVGEPDGAAAGSAEEVVAATAEAGSAAEASAALGEGGAGGGSEGGGGASGGGGGSGRGSIATAGLFAADMASNLGGGIARTASNKMSAVADAARARVAGTVGGQIASEIRNPGAAAAARAGRQGGGGGSETLTPATGVRGSGGGSRSSGGSGGVTSGGFSGFGSPGSTTSTGGFDSYSYSGTGSGSQGWGGSDGGALDGDGGPSEAIGADAGGFGGDSISGSQRGDNPSTRVDPNTEVSEFVNRGSNP